MDITQLWKTYHLDLQHFIFSKMQDELLTDDLVQESFIKAYQNIHQLKNESKAKSWLFTIARNATLDHYRKAQKTVPLFEFNTTKTIEDNQEHSPKDCLPGIIKRLPKKYRKPLFLSDIKGMKQAQVALELQLPLATVKSQIQRGRKLIKQGYMDCCDYTENEKGLLVGEIKAKAHCKVCS